MNKNAILELITDRPDSNTYYNISDLNRVETVVKVIAEYMKSKGYPVAVKEKPTGEWILSDMPTDKEMSRYLKNVTSIRNQLNKKSYKLPKTMTMLTFEDANNIERLLKDVEITLTKMITSYRRTGVTISGEGQFLDYVDLSPYIDVFGTLTFRERVPVIDDGILNLEYATFANGILQDL